MPLDSEDTPAPKITLELTGTMSRLLLSGDGAKEFTVKDLGAWADEADRGSYGIMLKLTPVQLIAAVAPEQAVASVVQSIAAAMPPHRTPGQIVLESLLASPATRDVAEYLIKPLLGRDPPLEFDPGKMREQIMRTADRFQSYFVRELEFAAAHLLEGKHRQWPDAEEFYAAFGRYREQAHRKKEAGRGADGNGRAVA